VPEQPDAAHTRPEGASDELVAAAGKVAEAYEWIVRARGHLYDFHQMMGHADATLGEGVVGLRDAGHVELADELATRWIGRNALPDRWTFEIVEAFDDTYYEVATELQGRVRDETMGGKRHVFEAEMKAGRRDGSDDEAATGPTDDR
jgi:hypothetical protein